MTPVPIAVPLAVPSTPVVYQLQGTGEIDIKALTTTYDGTLAASAFYPVMSIYTADDRLLSRTRVQEAVAVGAQAVVTFAPFLRKAATSAVTDFGTPLQDLPLYAIGNAANADASGLSWVFAAAASRGGYMTNPFPANLNYFTALILMEPKGAIFGFNYDYFVGASYGKIQVSLASVGYQLASRPSGSTAGKVQGYDGGYGPALSYVTWGTTDAYDPGADTEVAFNGQLPIIIGGDEGDTLTSFSAGGADPYTGFNIANGGPGWYRVRFRVNGKNAASSNYRIRITAAALERLDDAGAP